ncbi:hypothetical protein N7533_011505 [Penicillium manginii]|uniref:uncharacterized protein n=1 Tax=Penicillium manginii TaxID=203109 RepID=UPI0025498B5C|nr:uncharacterized protein N7533_011505 [Penicillium manginii]KAJ5742096.1 hypothetical protein N7533_011505 [Penicillium manginii]
MIKANHGPIITVGSITSFVALGEMVDYCCSKASALAFHEGLRQQLQYWYNEPNVRTRVFTILLDVLGSLIQSLRQRHSPYVGSHSLTGKESHNRPATITPKVVFESICKHIVTQSCGQPGNSDANLSEGGRTFICFRRIEKDAYGAADLQFMT